MNNADKIRQMTDEELAAFLVHIDCKTCANNNSERMRECDIGRCLMYTEKWLKQEVSEDAGTD